MAPKWYQVQNYFVSLFYDLRTKDFEIMATKFVLRTDAKKGLVPINIRVRSVSLNINIRQSTPFTVPAEKWNLNHEGTAWLKYVESGEGYVLDQKLKAVKQAIDSMLDANTPVTSAQVKKIVDDIYYAEQRAEEARKKEEKRKAAEEARRVTLNKYIERYIREIETGARQTDRGLRYSPNTVKAVKTALMKFAEFQEVAHRRYDFKDIDLKFYNEYTSWLKVDQNYSVNSVGKCISNLKVVMNAARSEGYHTNDITSEKKFKSTRVEVDAIFLTREELDRIAAVDLSGQEPTLAIARDIFLVGCWTAQRVSDYNNIRKEDFESYTRKFVVEEDDPQNPGKKIDVVKTEEVLFLNVRQQKTGARVAIPVSTQLREILERYNYQLPHLADQTINEKIKIVGELAGITEPVEIVTTKGGSPVRETFPKNELIKTHTARRTGATLMYLAGMDIYDIMKITGHTSPAVLKKYIRADELQVVDKIKGKYNYFD